MVDGKKDFFVTYNHRDREWAEWIAWILEGGKYEVILQDWDFRPGSNFVLEMQGAAERAERTIAVVSPNYLHSDFVKPEWATAFAEDPTGALARLVPVLVERCDVAGMFAQISRIDLTGLDEATAKTKLLAGVMPGRAKPSAPPPFPGPKSTTTGSRPIEAGAPCVDSSWRALRDTLPFVWRDGHRPDRLRATSSATLEIHLVPEKEQRLSVRSLTSLPEKLIALGQDHGVFEIGRHVDRSADDRFASAETEGGPARDGSGILVARGGQRGAWFTLPHDNMGSVFDSADVSARLERIVPMLLAVPVEAPSAMGVAVRIEPTTLLQVGQVSDLNGRSSVSLSYAMRSVTPVTPDDVVASAWIRADPTGFVDEVVARLEAALNR